MSIRGLNSIVGHGVISDDFRKGILNGRRAELIHSPAFDLSPDERSAVLAIQADSFMEFAAAVEALIRRREGESRRAHGQVMASRERARGWPADPFRLT